jgi:hypothetical protein
MALWPRVHKQNAASFKKKKKTIVGTFNSSHNDTRIKSFCSSEVFLIEF